MFCQNCGKEIDDKAYVCPHCGVKVERKNAPDLDADNGSKVGWGFLSFFVPVAGLILFIVWRTERPKTSKVCGICALASFITEVVSSIVSVIVYFVFIIGLMSYGTMATLPLFI